MRTSCVVFMILAIIGANVAAAMGDIAYTIINTGLFILCGIYLTHSD